MLQKRPGSETPVGSISETVDIEVSQETEVTESDGKDAIPDHLPSSPEQHRTRTVSRSFSYQKSKFSVSRFYISNAFLKLKNHNFIELTVKINRTNSGYVNKHQCGSPILSKKNNINTL